ncbi:Transcriptional protein swt1 [Smittium mucronatum]|uniref:Transcriptional protein swt1 n=1 Tax=Smittium mucronatum TaxID=133383 RepID=A0A1R0GN71_9FUNG|nr:Transcriptional protein swt1 [Smittium mucronatum]
MVPYVVLGELDYLHKYAGSKSKKNHSKSGKTNETEESKGNTLSNNAKKAILFLLECQGPKSHGRNISKKHLSASKALRCQKIEETLEKDPGEGDDKILDCCRYFSVKKKMAVGLLTFDRNLELKARVHEISVLGKFNGSGSQFLKFVRESLSPLDDKSIELALNSPTVISNKNSTKKKNKNTHTTTGFSSLVESEIIEPVYFETPSSKIRDIAKPTKITTLSSLKRKFDYDCVYIKDLTNENETPSHTPRTYAEIMSKRIKSSENYSDDSFKMDFVDTNLFNTSSFEIKQDFEMVDVEMSDNIPILEANVSRKIANPKSHLKAESYKGISANIPVIDASLKSTPKKITEKSKIKDLPILNPTNSQLKSSESALVNIPVSSTSIKNNQKIHTTNISFSANSNYNEKKLACDVHQKVDLNDKNKPIFDPTSEIVNSSPKSSNPTPINKKTKKKKKKSKNNNNSEKVDILPPDSSVKTDLNVISNSTDKPIFHYVNQDLDAKIKKLAASNISGSNLKMKRILVTENNSNTFVKNKKNILVQCKGDLTKLPCKRKRKGTDNDRKPSEVKKRRFAYFPLIKYTPLIRSIRSDYIRL